LAQEADAAKRAAESDAARHAGEVLSLKAALEAMQDELAKAKKDNSALKAELNDVKNSTSKDAAYVASLEKAKRTLEQQLEEQKVCCRRFSFSPSPSPTHAGGRLGQPCNNQITQCLCITGGHIT
jgi:septal ring factor EnvC (AmiA/AmiB activator)